MAGQIAKDVPQIPNPYPGVFEAITDFRYVSTLLLAREPEALDMHNGTSEAKYIVAAPYTVTYKIDGKQITLTVPKGMLTDLTSVPMFARPFIGRVGPHLEAAIIHDFLFIAWQLIPGYGAFREDWKFANALMYAALEAASVGIFTRSAIRVALEFPLFSWSVYEDPNQGLFAKLDESLFSTETGLLEPQGEPSEGIVIS